MKTNHSRLVTPEHSGIIKNKSRALSPFGPVRAGLTILPTTNDQQLLELLNYLERKVDELIYKSCGVLDTLTTDTQRIEAVLHFDTTNESTGTE